jgi:hypothetical protein
MQQKRLQAFLCNELDHASKRTPTPLRRGFLRLLHLSLVHGHESGRSEALFSALADMLSCMRFDICRACGYFFGEFGVLRLMDSAEI